MLRSTLIFLLAYWQQSSAQVTKTTKIGAAVQGTPVAAAAAASTGASWDQTPAGISSNGQVVDDVVNAVASSRRRGTGSATVAADISSKCPEVPLMPQRVTIKRHFWGMRNTLSVIDRKGSTILTIRTKWFEWDHLDRLWKFSGANLYKEKQGALNRGWKFNTFMSSDHEFMADSSGDPYDLEVRDCDRALVAKTHVNGIYRAFPLDENTKSGFFIIQTHAPEANQAIIFDLAQPDPAPMVKFFQSEPCWLFPLCTYLTDKGWLALLPWVAREWQAEVVMKGYGQVIGELGVKANGDGFREAMGANAAIDVRFLALFSLHIFGASKLAPCQQWFMSLIVGGFMVWCCARCCFPKKEEREVKIEEEEEIYASANLDGTNKYSSPWHCCSRQGQHSKYVAALNSKTNSQLIHEMEKNKVPQKEIDKCLDSADPKQSFIEALSGVKTKTMFSTRRALE